MLPIEKAKIEIAEWKMMQIKNWKLEVLDFILFAILKLLATHWVVVRTPNGMSWTLLTWLAFIFGVKGQI